MLKDNYDTIKKVLHYMKKYIPILILSLVLATVTVGMTLYFPILVGDALDYVIEKGNVDFSGIMQVLKIAIIVIAINAFSQWLMTTSAPVQSLLERICSTRAL